MEIEVRDGATIFSLQGALDIQAVSQMRDVAMDVIETASGPHVVNASGVTLVDSSGVGFLVSLYKQARSFNQRLVFAGLSGQALETLTHLKIDQAIPVYPDLESALQAVGEEA